MRAIRARRERKLSPELVLSSMAIAALMVLAQSNLAEILRPDRAQHFFLSLFVFLPLAGVLQGGRGGWSLAFAATLIAGLLKEIGDPQFQWFDMGANVLGLVVGCFLAVILFGIFEVEDRTSNS